MTAYWMFFCPLFEGEGSDGFAFCCGWSFIFINLTLLRSPIYRHCGIHFIKSAQKIYNLYTSEYLELFLLGIKWYRRCGSQEDARWERCPWIEILQPNILNGVSQRVVDDVGKFSVKGKGEKMLLMCVTLKPWGDLVVETAALAWCAMLQYMSFRLDFENTVSKNKRTFFFNLKTTGLIMSKSNIIIFFKLHSFKYFFINVVTIET